MTITEKARPEALADSGFGLYDMATPQLDWRPETQTIRFFGDLDSGNAILGRECIRRALQLGVGLLTLEMSQVDFIDAAWLGVLMGAWRFANDHGRGLTVSNPSRRVTRVLDLIGLNRLLER